MSIHEALSSCSGLNKIFMSFGFLMKVIKLPLIGPSGLQTYKIKFELKKLN